MIPKPDSCASCILYSPPWGKPVGFVPADGTGRNGVLIVLEAAGQTEEEDGRPVVGKAGHFLFSQLARIGLERDDFRIHNVLSCRPPDNKLAKMPYETAAIEHCATNLDATIREMQERCKLLGKHFTILTLGRIAFKRIMGLSEKHPIMKEDYQCYPHWSEKYQAWVIAGDHPSYLLKGNNHLIPVLQFAARRAVEIAECGVPPDDGVYLCDPTPAQFTDWVKDYLEAVRRDPGGTLLSYDIETPHKKGKNEEKVAKEDDDDYTILRCAFSYQPGEAVSVPWTAAYMQGLETLFSTPALKLGWNVSYDSPRVRAQMPLAGVEVDGMVAWHVLNSALPKGLGFVTPFYCQRAAMWKHLSDSEPALYNAKDADFALRNWLGIADGLKEVNLWPVFDRHILKLNEALAYMSGKGVLRDEAMRREAEHKLSELLAATEIKMQGAVPQAARRLHPKNGYKREPKSTEGLVKTLFTVPIQSCSRCGAKAVSKRHVTPRKAKPNPCEGAKLIEVVEQVERWAKPLDFKISSVGLKLYQSALQHQAIIHRREKRVTFDDTALKQLIRKYPGDHLYPLIGAFREYQKLLTTYIGVTQYEEVGIVGGMSTGKDGRIRTTYTHNPSTLRLASQDPNLQNLPRPGGEDDLQTVIRNLIIAGPGCVLLARDYSGIEAVLVGYEARSPSYIRLAKMDIHSFYTAYALNQLDGRVHSSDLPLASWDDEKLASHLAGIKAEFKKDRNQLYKHLVHGANFVQGPKGAQEKILKESGVEYPVGLIAKVMSIYFELFPEIRKWQVALQLQADKDGYLRNAYGYIHRFYKVFNYKKVNGSWQREPGPDANRVVAFLPQSNAAGIIKEAILRLYFDRFEEAGQYLRLQVHDEILNEVPEDRVEAVDRVLQEEMEKPIKELPLPASYKMGEYLVINTEPKTGLRWGSMH